jgi:DNA-binding transcriptional LysR family regulator
MSRNRSINFDWNHARAFLVTAEKGSLSAAAIELGLTQPTLSRQVSALEESMNVALFERGTNGLDLTPSGLHLLGFIKDMGEAASRFTLSASGQSESLRGKVCITATELLSTYTLPKILVDFQRHHPEIKIELISSNNSSDLKKREADIAIRAYRPTQPDLIAKRLGIERFKLFAANSYIENFGVPSNTLKIASHKFVGINQDHRARDILQACGLELDKDQFSIFTESSLSNWALVKAGAGIGIMTEEIGMSNNDVQVVLPDIVLPTMELWIVAHRELRTSRRIRYVFDFLAEALKRE